MYEVYIIIIIAEMKGREVEGRVRVCESGATSSAKRE